MFLKASKKPVPKCVLDWTYPTSLKSYINWPSTLTSSKRPTWEALFQTIVLIISKWKLTLSSHIEPFFFFFSSWCYTQLYTHSLTHTCTHHSLEGIHKRFNVGLFFWNSRWYANNLQKKVIFGSVSIPLIILLLG